MKTAGETALENVNNLLKSSYTGYEIFQETGIGQDKISKLRNDKIKVLNLSSGIFIKLSDFWEKNSPK